MTSGIHLAAVVVAADQFWPHLTAILHWHRHAGPVQRLSLLHLAEKSASAGGPAATAALLERVVRTACPGVRIERREADASPDAIQSQLAAWQKDAPDQSWIFQLPGACSTAAWGLDDLLLLPGCRVIQRQPNGNWLELRRAAPGAAVEAETLPAFRREESDELAIVDLVRAQTADTPTPSPLLATPAKPLPLVPLTAAAMTAAWDWKQAFANAVPEFAAESAAALFVRYLGALVLDLGLKNVVQGSRRARSNTPATAPADPLLWIHHGGRLVVIDARLESTAGAAESDASSSTTLPPLAADLLRAVEERRDLGGLTPDWLLIRPCHALQPVEQHLAAALGIKVVDETGCRDLPARLAAHFGLPLSPDAVEIERRLRTHLAESGRTRAFAPESTLLQQQRSTAPDPVVVHTDGLLDQVQRARGQNWLLWIHNERVHLRVPTEGRASASGDWRAMLAAFVGLDPALVQSRQTQRVVLIDFPETPEHRRRVADWLRPFLNAALTFDAARARFAAEARVTAEAEAAARTNARPGTGPSPAPASPHANPAATGQPRSAKPAAAPTPKPTPPRPAATPAAPAPRRMQRVSLEDLDRALDSAFISPPNPDAGPAKK